MVSGSSAAGVEVPPAATAAGADADIDGVLRRATELVAGGRRDEAIDLLDAFDAPDRAPEVARRILQLRHEAFADLAEGPGRTAWPPDYADLFADSAGRSPR